MTLNSRNVVVLVVLLFTACILFVSGNHGKATSTLSVTFTGWTSNPVWTPPPNRLELGRGASGLSATGTCALFWVTNAGSPKDRVWFDTLQVEQKVDGQWRAFTPTSKEWSGVEGSVWMGGYGCMYAIEQPPGLTTNAVWRLQVRFGRDRSSFRLMINSWLGREFFPLNKEDYVSLPSSEVIP
jgi:hypothetical protein